MIKIFKKAVLKGDFDKALTIYNDLPKDISTDILIDIAMLGNILAYGFVCRLITHNNSAENHLIASVLFTTACFIEGAYLLAFYHAQIAANLSSDTIYHEHLLYFNEIPDKLLNDTDAKK